MSQNGEKNSDMAGKKGRRGKIGLFKMVNIIILSFIHSHKYGWD